MRNLSKARQKEIITKMVGRNTKRYNILKAMEEMTELSLILNQLQTKPKKVKQQAIIDEIGDASIRLMVLKQMFPNKLIEKRISMKLTNYLDGLTNSSRKRQI